MNLQYEEVPNIISCKDLDYLSDMFNWNYSAYKNALNVSKNILDENLKIVFDECSKLFYDELNNILNVLNGGNENE